MTGNSLYTIGVHSLAYRHRRITVRPSGKPDYDWCAFVDGWPVSNRRRGDPGSDDSQRSRVVRPWPYGTDGMRDPEFVGQTDA